MSGSIHIDDITFYRDREDGDTVVWVDRSGELPFGPNTSTTEGGTASLLIDVGVDGDITIVQHRGGTRAVLEKVIADLGYLIERLDAIYPETESRGRCLVYGDWGRCWGEHGHAEHKFPSEDEWRGLQAVRRAVRGVA